MSSHLSPLFRAAALATLAGASVLAGAIPAHAGGTQPIDATIAMQCIDADGTAADRVSAHIIGSTSASLAEGDFVQFAWSSTTLKITPQFPVPTVRGLQLIGFTSGLQLALQGTSLSDRDHVGPFGPGGFTLDPVDGGYNPFSVNFPTPPPLAPGRAGSGPVTATVASLSYAAILKDAPVDPRPPTPYTCTPDAGQPPIATITVDAAPTPTPTPTPVVTPAPVLVPAVSRVYGNAWAGIGGLLRIHGTQLKGAKLVTIGAKSVRPLLVIGSGDIWVLAPALPKGDYPVSVRTAAGTSPTATPATIRYR